MTTLFIKTRATWQLLRTYQWTKNLLVLAALIFAKEAGDPAQVGRALLALAAFCLASSSAYIFNDIIDIPKDRAHPKKRLRPLASGALSVPYAIVVMVALFVGAVCLAWFGLHVRFLMAVLFYLALTVSYSLVWKHLVILDVMVLALGFVVRAMAGAIALDVVFSKWLVVCTLFLALFLALAKRRSEIILLDQDAAGHRGVLQHYTTAYLDSLIHIVAGGALLTYTIYTCSPEVEANFGTDKLYVTLPFVVYGLFRYLYLVQHKTGGGDPSRTLIKDWPLGLTVALWGLANIAIIYWL
ncbi:decaprenyl-phosphate phosphoribosyltransferase [Roseovarius pacificus]|uniref:decaprenyl-phosphate phosphoribosyltransferase n=1 Tax=Roseovarius pacificus TaxID=337701 RepID=UPI002A1889D9|nr:decaprenyl-phosphate phosphoribosyltransferase [Roseovarius pacificus]